MWRETGKLQISEQGDYYLPTYLAFHTELSITLSGQLNKKQRGNWCSLTQSLWDGEKADKMRYINISGRLLHQNIQPNTYLKWKYPFLKTSFHVYFIQLLLNLSLYDCKLEAIQDHLLPCKSSTSECIIQHNQAESSKELIKFSIFRFKPMKKWYNLNSLFININEENYTDSRTRLRLTF
jgi:hypothetical protein